MVVAYPSVLARIGGAFVDVDFALFPAVSRQAVADELVDAVLTAPSMFARVGLAFVDVAQATRVEVTSRTFASETVD